ncbi:DUF1501 domain-containing protein [Catellatospora bangladeshensis]|uniref:DUF1501 domain-containing protein n=1 Tax=Catellatospora bangladeshensis TaxID=310355 RepID=UPI003622D2FF
MDKTTRRRFLIASGVVGGGALAAGAATLSLTDLFDTAGERPEGAKTLVVITLYGGNDGLNTVVPHADKAYQDARPELAYDGGEVLRLDDGTGLNPGLKGLHGLFGTKRLAIVRGVGYPKPDRSHFRSMDIWQTASPSGPATPAGSAAGSTARAPTRGWPCRSRRCCRRCWPGRTVPGRSSARPTRSCPRRSPPTCSPGSPRPPPVSRRCRPAPRRASATWPAYARWRSR